MATVLCQMTPALHQIETAAWSLLGEAAAGDGALRILSLATVDPSGFPQVRSIVLREVDQNRHSLTFHTDVRSAKWHELTQTEGATVLGWDSDHRIQMRLAGEVALYGPGSPLAQAAWAVLPPWTKASYAGPAPATPLDAPADAAPSSASGQDHFGVLMFRARSLDWCQLERDNNRRAYFAYEGAGLITGTWIAT